MKTTSKLLPIYPVGVVYVWHVGVVYVWHVGVVCVCR